MIGNLTVKQSILPLIKFTVLLIINILITPYEIYLSNFTDFCYQYLLFN